MENTRTSIWASIIDTIRAFTSTEVDRNGKIEEEKLTAEDKKLLAEIRKMDAVEKIEGTSIRKKYGATVDEAEAKVKASLKEKQLEEKTIGSK